MEYFNFVVIASVVNWIGEGIQVREDPKIQGGENVTDMARFPFIGYYEASKGDHVVACSGILFAGHCVVVNMSVNPYRLLPLNEYKPLVVFGSANIFQVLYPFCKRRDIKKLFIHPKARCDRDYPVEMQYDIGAMKWAMRVALNPRIQLIPLIPEEMNPNKVFDEVTINGTHCEFPGWGELIVHWTDPSKNVPTPGTLQVAEFRVIPKYTCCWIYYKDKLGRCMQRLGTPESGLFCMIRQKLTTSIALGDSGSPLYCPYKGKKYVIRMNVAGRNALDPFPDGLIEVFNPSYYVIDSVMRSYIETIRDTPNAFSRSHKTNVGVLIPKLIFATFAILGVFSSFIWTINFVEINKNFKSL